jgi:hypothetical protein
MDDTEAPKRGFRLDNAFDGVEIRLNFMKWQDPEVLLGQYDKGKWNMVPEIFFRVTITKDGSIDEHEFLFDPKDPSNTESRYTQTITYRPAKWNSG